MRVEVAQGAGSAELVGWRLGKEQSETLRKGRASRSLLLQAFSHWLILGQYPLLRHKLTPDPVRTYRYYRSGITHPLTWRGQAEPGLSSHPTKDNPPPKPRAFYDMTSRC